MFENTEGKNLFQALNPAFPSPTAKQIRGPLFDEIYEDLKAKVCQILSSSSNVNVIFDGSKNVNSERVLNICIQVPHSSAFYWKTINTGTI
jgi:hypothetical protein